jgi:hypothetical protein
VNAVAAGEKALLLAIVFLAGWGMHRAAPASGRAAKTFAGVLYAVNPFVYDRLYTGQWFILLGYALLPHAYVELARLVEGRRRPWRFAWLAFGVGVASPHMFVLLLLLTVAVAAARPRDAGIVARGVGLAALPSLYWLIPTPGLTDFLGRINHDQLALYRTLSDPVWGRGINVAGLYGYWNDAAPIKSSLAFWPLLTAGLVSLALYGIVMRRRDRLTWAVTAAAVVAFVIALGDAAPLSGRAFVFLLDHVQVARSFREPQKAVALLVFAYAFLGAAAVDHLVKSERGKARRAALGAVLLALPFTYGYREFGSLWGALRTSSYPASWTAAAAKLETASPPAHALFLPWHGYMALSFAHHRVVANPAPGFFGRRVLASKDVGEGAGTADNADPIDAYVSALLAKGPQLRRLGSCLAPLGVSHVLLATVSDYARYGFLARQRDLAVERRWPDLVLYRNKGGRYSRAECGGIRLPTQSARGGGRGAYIRNYAVGIAGLLVLFGLTVGSLRRRQFAPCGGRHRGRHPAVARGDGSHS